MLEIQKNFASYLESLGALLADTAISADARLLPRVLQTELVVPVIGSFSAGKSSLLNTLIGQSILPVGLAPETELATELRYSPEPYLLAIRGDGTEERLHVEALGSINERAREFSHLQLYIDSPALKRIAPLVLVDMPGYGSSLESHNKAIAFYLPRGVHFVVVTSIEDGNLTQSMIRRLDEVKAFGGDFTFVLSKCNLRDSGQVETVRSYIDEQLLAYFGEGHRILPVGKEASEQLAEALGRIDPERLFCDLFLDTLKTQSHDLVRQVNLAMGALKKDTNQSARELQDLEQALLALQQQKENARQELGERYAVRLLNRCLRGVEKDLSTAVDELATLATGPNRSALNNAISEVIRSSLTRNIKEEIDDISDSLIDDLSSSLSQAGAQLSDLASAQSLADDISARVRSSLNQTNQALTTWSAKLEEQQDASERLARLYKGVSVVLAVTTSVITPVLELVIIFLPEIVRFFNAGQERQNIMNKLHVEVIPGIKAEMRNRLPSILDEQLKLVLDQVNASFEAQITQQHEILTTYQQRREASQADTDARVAVLDELCSSLKALATQYLYA
ncbi:dynamin family protein [Pseudomonas sp. NY15436]|uniref:dynamin family protein n=1 Tax=Pseudomonas sp. NY15436 TaxID=3400359 RepID=UPI003A8A87C9